MLLYMQPVKHTHRDNIVFKLPQEWDTTAYHINKNTVCNVLQMLQAQESTIILQHKNCSITVYNQGSNTFVISCQTPKGCLQAMCTQQTTADSSEESMQDLLKYMKQQMIPLFSDCVRVSNEIQKTFGFLRFSSTSAGHESKKVDDMFYLNNATIVSKLTDIMNFDKTFERTYSASYACRLLQIAAIFCATAKGEKNSLLHVGQTMTSDISQPMLTSLYEKDPEKQHTTLLLKGNTKQQRIHRINLAVRILPPSHAFVTEHLATVLGLNASTPHAPVMVLTGVRSNVAAAIYINTDLATLQQHNLALDAYMQM